MNILICDDMQVEADALNKLIADSGIEINTIVFDNASDALNCIRSYILNMNAVTIMRGSNLIMQNGAIVPISRSYYEAKEQYIKYVLGGSRK